MISGIRHLTGALLLNLLGFSAAVTAVIALSYLPQVSIFVFASIFFACLMIFGTIATRVLLSDCISNRPWREAAAIEGISLVCGLALNYAVLAIGTIWAGADDIRIILFSVVVCGAVLAAGGGMYLNHQVVPPAKRFYIGIILWQSLSGVLAAGFIACLFWTWSWLV